MNRLRHDDYIQLFESVGHNIIVTQEYTDDRSEKLLKDKNFKLDERFKSKSEDILSIRESWIISSNK